jgi:CheY-like chemotaxis protein
MPLTDEPARILVVDDDAASLDLVTTWLQSHGYSVSQAADGNRAVSLGTEEKFDLVILDVHMPTYDGIEILRFLRKRYVRRPVKVIALTGDSTETVRARLTRYGIDSYMTKPVELKALLDEVQRLLDQASAG